MLRLTSVAIACLLVSACGSEPEAASSQSSPAQPTPSPSVPGAGAGVAGAGLARGTGAPSFVGRWASDVSWCSNTQGDARPIEITIDRVEGYENSCAILTIDEAGPAYEATLRCEAEGTTVTERIRMAVSGQSMALTYLDRRQARVDLTKCTTLTNNLPAGSEASLSR